jgi:hypothetical protein
MVLISVTNSYREEMFQAMRAALLNKDVAGPLSVVKKMAEDMIDENERMEDKYKMDDEQLATMLTDYAEDLEDVFEVLFRDQVTDDLAERDEWAAAMMWLNEQQDLCEST